MPSIFIINVPTPAETKYKAAGHPKPPIPTINTEEFFNRFCPKQTKLITISYIKQNLIIEIK